MNTLKVGDKVLVDVTEIPQIAWNGPIRYMRVEKILPDDCPPSISGILTGTVVRIDLDSASIIVRISKNGFDIYVEVDHLRIKDVIDAGCPQHTL